VVRPGVREARSRRSMAAAPGPCFGARHRCANSGGLSSLVLSLSLPSMAFSRGRLKTGPVSATPIGNKFITTS
jgi:hypothetical protein